MTDRSPRNLPAIRLNRAATQPRSALAEITLKSSQPADNVGLVNVGPGGALRPAFDDRSYFLLLWWRLRRHLLGIGLPRYRGLSRGLLLLHLQLSLLHFLR